MTTSAIFFYHMTKKPFCSFVLYVKVDITKKLRFLHFAFVLKLHITSSYITRVQYIEIEIIQWKQGRSCNKMLFILRKRNASLNVIENM